MDRVTQPMRGEPVSDEERERRRTLVAAFYAERTLPVLYRLSTMDPRVTWGTLDETRARTRYVFERESALTAPRQEVHTLEHGVAQDIAPGLWESNFGTVMPGSGGEPSTIRVSISDVTLDGDVLATTGDGWMVAVQGESHTLLIIGTGSVPETVNLSQVDIDAVGREDVSYGE
jgi:hypothetical protein